MAKPDVTLNLDLAYPMRKSDTEWARNQHYDEDPEHPPARRDVSDFLIRLAVNEHQKYAPTPQAPRKGMPDGEYRLWDTITRLLSERTDRLTLPNDHFRWLHDLIKSFEFRPQVSSWRCLVLDEFERAKKVAEEPGSDKKAEAEAATAAA